MRKPQFINAGYSIHDTIDMSRRGGGYSEEYQAVLDRATALGYTQPSAAQKTKQNTLIQSLKDAGIWDLLDVFYVFATDGGSDFATLNWKSPSSNQCSKVNSPTFTANLGFTGNGTTSYLNTNWIPSNGVNYTRDNSSFFAHENSAVSNDGSLVGVLTGTFNNTLTTKAAAGSTFYSINGATVTSLPNNGTSVGLWHLKRTGSAAISLLKNGSVFVTNTTSSTGRPTSSVYLLARNNAGSADFLRPTQISVFGAGASLNTKESSLYTAWNTYLTSL